MSIVDKLSAWVLGIYADKALGAKVLKSIMCVLPEDISDFYISDICPEVAYVESKDEDVLLTFCVHLEEDVDVSYESVNTLEEVTVLRYPLSLIS